MVVLECRVIYRVIFLLKMGDLQLAMIAEVQQEGKFNQMLENYPQ